MAKVMDPGESHDPEEAEDERALGARNVVAQVLYGSSTPDGLDRDWAYRTSPDKRNSFQRLSGTGPSKRRSATNVPPPAPLYLRPVVAIPGYKEDPGAPSYRGYGPPPPIGVEPGQALARNRPKPPPHKTCGSPPNLFGICFGGQQQVPPVPAFTPRPSLGRAGPSIPPDANSRRSSQLRNYPPEASNPLVQEPDSKKLAETNSTPTPGPASEANATTSTTLGLESTPTTSSTPGPPTVPAVIDAGSTSTPVLVTPTADTAAPTGPTQTESECRRCSALSKRFSAENEAKPTPETDESKPPVAAAVSETTKVLDAIVTMVPGPERLENNAGTSTGPAAQRQDTGLDTMSAVQRGEASSSREFDSGASPIRGLRPNRASGSHLEGYFGDYPTVNGLDLGLDDGQYLEAALPLGYHPYYHHQGYEEAELDCHFGQAPPPNTAQGVTRLFDAIIGGRGDYTQGGYRFQRRAPRLHYPLYHGQPGLRQPVLRRPRAQAQRHCASNWDHSRAQPGEIADPEEDVESEPYSPPPRPDSPPESSSRYLVQSVDIDHRAAVNVDGQRRAPGLSSSDYEKDQSTPSEAQAATKDHQRTRGQPDPSFNPRPGDIIIRARKRSGLRLTDFYYYDDENYMEEGDQILRAKFDYIPPTDTMYLWCRLYVYGADGRYTYLDSTSEVVSKFRSGEVDVKTFKQPQTFVS